MGKGVDNVEAIPINRLKAVLTDVAARIGRAEHRWLSALGEFHRRRGWIEDGYDSCAQWLQAFCGLKLRTAYEHVRVARALENLPKISAAMARGKLSYAKARALSRVANETTEGALLNMALQNTADCVEHLLSAPRSTTDTPQAHGRKACGVTYVYDRDGSLVLKARLSSEHAAALVAALESAAAETPDASRSLAVRRVDALVVIAAAFLNSRTRPEGDGAETPSSPPGTSSPPSAAPRVN
jgi:hypothetical protein